MNDLEIASEHIESLRREVDAAELLSRHAKHRLAEATEHLKKLQGPGKRAVFEHFIAKGAVLVHVDARRAGIVVPSQYAGMPNVALRFGLNLQPPVPFAIGEDELCGELSFKGMPFAVTLPWNAIYAIIVDGSGGKEGMIWPLEVPKELGPQVEEKPAEPPAPEITVETTPEPVNTAAKHRSHLRLVD